MNIWDILILAAIAAALILAAVRMKKRRGSGCSGSCAGCKGCPGVPEKGHSDASPRRV